MTNDIGKEIKWNKFLMQTDHYETKDSDEKNSNYCHSQVFTDNQNDDKMWPLTGAKMRYIQRSDSMGNTFFQQKDPKKKIRLGYLQTQIDTHHNYTLTRLQSQH